MYPPIPNPSSSLKSFDFIFLLPSNFKLVSLDNSLTIINTLTPPDTSSASIRISEKMETISYESVFYRNDPYSVKEFTDEL